jgi:hypothetical protein
MKLQGAISRLGCYEAKRSLLPQVRNQGQLVEDLNTNALLAPNNWAVMLPKRKAEKDMHVRLKSSWFIGRNPLTHARDWDPDTT